eukprot:scaffold125_cov240-Pinguiococcus_pyrenoidosus.AAC.1
MAGTWKMVSACEAQKTSIVHSSTPSADGLGEHLGVFGVGRSRLGRATVRVVCPGFSAGLTWRVSQGNLRAAQHACVDLQLGGQRDADS